MIAFLFTLAVAVSPNEVLDTARGYLGHPYVYGGSGTYGFDCSSLVQTVFAKHGYVLPRTAGAQATLGRAVEWTALQTGDLLFFTDTPGNTRVAHVGIAVDAEHMIHASTGRGEVVIDPLSMRYYMERRLVARRLLDQPPGPPLADDAMAQLQEPRGPSLSAVPRPSLWHHGPLALQRIYTGAGVSLAAASLEGGELMMVAPHLSLRHEVLDAEAVLQVPLAIRGESLSPAWRYDTPESYLRLLGAARLGQPEGNLYVEASRGLSLNLGEGLLVAGSTPASTSSSFPGLPADGSFALASRAVIGGTEIAAVADDVVRPALLGLMLGAGAHNSVRLAGALDPTAPSDRRSRARGALSAEGVLSLVDSETLVVTTDAALALAQAAQPAPGLQAGTWVKVRRRTVELAARGALRLHDPGFVPGLFGVDYRYLREQGFSGTPLWDELDDLALASPWRWGYTLTGQLSITRRFAARAVYTADAALTRPGEHLPLDAMELGLVARDFYLSSLDALASFYLTYHRRLLGAGTLSTANDHEIVFAGAHLQLGAYTALGAQLAKRGRDGTSVWEGTTELSFDLPL